MELIIDKTARKSKFISFTVTQEEFDALSKIVEEKNASISSVVRALVVFAIEEYKKSKQ